MFLVQGIIYCTLKEKMEGREKGERERNEERERERRTRGRKEGREAQKEGRKRKERMGQGRKVFCSL